MHIARFAPETDLPLLASLVGNDFVQSHYLSRLHAAVLPGRHASGSPLIEALCRCTIKSLGLMHMNEPAHRTATYEAFCMRHFA